MQRPALRELSGNQLNSKHVQIFEDAAFRTEKTTAKLLKPNRTDAEKPNKQHFLQGVIKLQTAEIQFLRKKCAFLKFSNAILRSSKATAKDSSEASKSIITPKKRRLESQYVINDTEGDDSPARDQNSANSYHSTPSRYFGHNSTTTGNIPTTPVSILKHSIAYNNGKNKHNKENISNNQQQQQQQQQAPTSSSSSILKQFATASPPISPNKLRTPTRSAGIADPVKQQNKGPQQKQHVKKVVLPLTDKLKAMEKEQQQQQSNTTDPRKSHDIDKFHKTDILLDKSEKEELSPLKQTHQQSATTGTTQPAAAEPSNGAAATESDAPPKVNLQEPTVSVPKPLYEQATLHTAISKATSSGIKTLFREKTDKYALCFSPVSSPTDKNNNGVTKHTTSINDALLKYRSNNNKINTQNMSELLKTPTTVTALTSPLAFSVQPPANGRDKVVATQHQTDLQASLLETSLTNYHHTSSSVLSPLSPLGEQNHSSSDVSGPGISSATSHLGGKLPTTAAAPAPVVALSSLSILQSKMDSWRGKYKS